MNSRASWTSLVYVGIACFGLLLGGLVASTPGFAQEDEFGEAPAAKDPAEAPAEPAAPAANPPSAKPVTNQPGPPKISALRWAFEALGIRYTVAFLAISFTFVALLVMNILSCRRENFCPAHLVDGFESHLNEKRYQEAYDMAKADDSFLGRILSSGLAKLNLGYPQAIEAMQEVGEEENMKLEHRLGYLALIGTISPMVGLLGTVDGMIMSFSVIANSTSTPKPYELAKGISTALFTTLVGLLIAIPAMTLYNILKNRFARQVLEVGIVSEGLMSRFQGVSQKKA